MFPSVGSISIPADVPHFRPSGSWPQFACTTGAGFGRPSPVIGFPAATVVLAAPDLASESGEHPLSRNTQASTVDIRTRGEDMGSLLVAVAGAKYPGGPPISLGRARDNRTGQPHSALPYSHDCDIVQPGIERSRSIPPSPQASSFV